jgi:hypothetical protein
MKRFSTTFSLIILSFISFQSLGSIVVLNGLTHTHTGIEGSVVVGKIKLRNDGQTDEKFISYQQDLIFYCGKEDNFSDSISHDRSMKKWLKTSVDERVLTPGEEYELSYTINIPKESIEKGTYWTVIMIEPGEPVTTKQESGLKINTKVRYAVKVLLDVNLFEYPKLIFENIVFKKITSTSRMIEISLKNNGLFAVSTKLQIEIYDAKGVKLKTIDAKQRRVFPDKCSQFEIEVTDLPSGKYDAILVADNGQDLIGSNLAIEIE